jgi:Xaa-Pro aminopeptidase
MEALRSMLPDANLIEAVNVFRDIRLIKTPPERELLKLSAVAIEQALKEVVAAIDEGVTLGSLVTDFRGAMAHQGAYGSHITGGGGRHPWPLHPDLSYRIKQGDTLMLDPAGHRRHYWGDMGRTVVIGNTTSTFDEWYDRLLTCKRLAESLVKPGASVVMIKKELLSVLKDEKASHLSFVVHSIGIEQYDQPISLGQFLDCERDDLVLEEDMVVNLETSYAEFGWGMLHIEDTYLVEQDSATRLTTMDETPVRLL